MGSIRFRQSFAPCCLSFYPCLDFLLAGLVSGPRAPVSRALRRESGQWIAHGYNNHFKANPAQITGAIIRAASRGAPLPYGISLGFVRRPIIVDRLTVQIGVFGGKSDYRCCWAAYWYAVGFLDGRHVLAGFLVDHLLSCSALWPRFEPPLQCLPNHCRLPSRHLD